MSTEKNEGQHVVMVTESCEKWLLKLSKIKGSLYSGRLFTFDSMYRAKFELKEIGGKNFINMIPTKEIGRMVENVELSDGADGGDLEYRCTPEAFPDLYEKIKKAVRKKTKPISLHCVVDGETFTTRAYPIAQGRLMLDIPDQIEPDPECPIYDPRFENETGVIESDPENPSKCFFRLPGKWRRKAA